MERESRRQSSAILAPTNPQVPVGKSVWFKPSAKQLVQIPILCVAQQKTNPEHHKCQNSDLITGPCVLYLT